MNKSKLHLLSAILVVIIAFACQSENKKYYDKIELAVQEDLGAIDYAPSNLRFIDTIYVGDVLDSLIIFESKMMDTLRLVKDFDKENINLKTLGKLRNQELELRGVPTFYERVFSGQCASPWCVDFKAILLETDSLITKIDLLGDDNLILWKNIAWYKHRKVYFYNLTDSIQYWETIQDNIKTTIRAQKSIALLKTKPVDNVAQYKAIHIYERKDTLQQPLVRQVEAEIIFDGQLNVMRVKEKN
jgi:hypothetical protein